MDQDALASKSGMRNNAICIASMSPSVRSCAGLLSEELLVIVVFKCILKLTVPQISSTSEQHM